MRISESKYSKNCGFSLPSVVIISVVLLTVLAASVQLATSAANALREQYFQQLAREASEAGAIRVAQCVGENYTVNRVAQNTTCTGEVSGRAARYIVNQSNYRTGYDAEYDVPTKESKSVGFVEVTRKNNPAHVVRRYTVTTRQKVVEQFDQSATLPTKRWWYMGYGAVLDFSTDGSSPIATVSHNQGDSILAEGITTVSNKKGELLFYSDGLTIWNKDGKILQNSQGLRGSETGTQAVASFPVGRDESKYIVISNSTNSGGVARHGELYYSLIDMNLDNGKGGVVPGVKNIQLGGAAYASEAMNAMPDDTGTGYWVYTYTPNPVNNRIWGFHITEKQRSGFGSDDEFRRSYDQNPVEVSTIMAFAVTGGGSDGSVSQYTVPLCKNNSSTPSARASNESTGFGSINFTSDYRKMVVYMGGDRCGEGLLSYGTLHVFEINRSTGRLSHRLSWRGGYGREYPQGKRSIPNALYAGYSADFSPSGRYVYATTIYPGLLTRFDTQQGVNIERNRSIIGWTSCAQHTTADIRSYNGRDKIKLFQGSAFPIADLDSACTIQKTYSHAYEGGGQVLRGPDKRMYVADRGARHISVVKNPDAERVSDIGWEYAGIPLPKESLSFYGLPQMVTRYTRNYVRY